MIVREINSNQGRLYDSLVVDRETLEPLSRHQRTRDSTTMLAFDGRSVTGTIETGGTSQSV
jgi:hypothetical protein